MTRYERVSNVFEGVPMRTISDGSICLVADMPEEDREHTAVHVDTVRAVLDGFCKHYPNHPLCLASAASRHTPAAWHEFGLAHLPNEYPSLRLVDLNREELPASSLLIFLVRQNDPRSRWAQLQGAVERRYTPQGHVWHRQAKEGGEGDVRHPDLVLVDHLHVNKVFCTVI